jgi:hypothetical protein
MARLRRGVADAYWFNPRTGVLGSRFASVASGADAGVATFDPPGSAGYDNDWALKLVVRNATAPAGTTATATCPVVDDTAIRAGLTGAGGLATISTGGSATAPTHSLWRFSLACVPAGARIVAAQVKWMVYQASGGSVDRFDLYALKRPWVERSATWTHWAGTSAWAAAGAAHPALDRGATVLGTIAAGSADVVARAWVRAPLNPGGLEVLQQWRTGAQPNHGWLLTAASGTDTLRVLASETGSSANRPVLEITYAP